MGVPRLAFAAGGLRKGAGGIAELSRQVFRTLLEMRLENQLELELHVLDESGPDKDDELFSMEGLPVVHWYGGSRWRFTVGLQRSRANVFLYDHVGLARMQGMLPSFLARPYLLLIHSVEIWNNNRSDYHRTARNARLLIANSEYTARKARNHYSDLPDIAVCWPGKDKVEADTSSQSVVYENLGPHAMLIVGRLDAAQRHKGHDHLIEAMPLILEQEVPCWKWSERAETWETMRPYLLGTPHGSRSSLFVDQETGQAIKKIWNSLIHTGMFGPVKV